VHVGLSDNEDAPPFNASLPVISIEILQEMYSLCDELAINLMEASGYIANSVIEKNVQEYFSQGYGNMPKVVI
jgi:hypothetical protein